MSPFGPYATFDECVSKNADKSSPEGFCAWLEHKITGSWPGGMSADKFPSPFLAAYDTAMVAGKSEPEAYKEATVAAQAEGYDLTRFGWVKQFQAPTMKKITGVKVFAIGNWTDSAGVTRIEKNAQGLEVKVHDGDGVEHDITAAFRSITGSTSPATGKMTFGLDPSMVKRLVALAE